MFNRIICETTQEGKMKVTIGFNDETKFETFNKILDEFKKDFNIEQVLVFPSRYEVVCVNLPKDMIGVMVHNLYELEDECARLEAKVSKLMEAFTDIFGGTN